MLLANGTRDSQLVLRAGRRAVAHPATARPATAPVPPKLVPPVPVPTPPVPAVPVISRALTKLDVPYDEKENVKALHAQWDPVGKYWYVNPFTDLRPFARWVPGARINLNVPFAEKNAVKDLGAIWDPEAGKWHVHDKMKNLELFAKWMPSGGSSSSAESTPPKKRPRSA